MTGIERAVEKAGSRRLLAEALRPTVSLQALGQWIKRGWVPSARALEIERLYAIDRAYLVKPSLVALVGEPAL